MKDLHGDKIKVEKSIWSEAVYIHFKDEDNEIGMRLDAKKARKLARKLNRLASAIEIRTEGVLAND